jgi:Regulator of chromosome condensation (RCC1) repeat/IPT/TIG domain
MLNLHCHRCHHTAQGDLYTWGRGFEGQLGHGRTARSSTPEDAPVAASAADGVQLVPKAVAHFQPSKSKHKAALAAAGVACGNNFTLVVSTSGEVWSFGESGSGQLGNGQKCKSDTPQLCTAACPDSGSKFVAVAAGWAHSLALTADGSVYTWGLNFRGQLGIGDTKARFTPVRVVFDDNVVIKQIAACGSCCCALATNGAVYTWGTDTAVRTQQKHTKNTVSSSDNSAVATYSSTPQRMHALAGKAVFQIALHARGGAAMVPLTVSSLSVTMAPVTGGTALTLFGCGFWKSDDIVVRFAGRGTGVKQVSKAAVGVYEPPLNAGECDRIVCKVPKFPETGLVKIQVCVSAEGGEFIDTGCVMEYYNEVSTLFEPHCMHCCTASSCFRSMHCICYTFSLLLISATAHALSCALSMM